MSINADLMDTSMDDDNNAGSLFSAPISDDWYHGHKVVAMPSSAFGGMSIREVVSSRNTETATNNASTGARPRRSNSLGRGPIRPGRDIVQDVYDRMGVSYTRAMDYNSATEEETNYANAATSSNDLAGNASRTGRSRLSEKFSGRYRTAAAMARSTPSTTNTSINVNATSRGRNPEITTGTNSSPRGRTLEAEGADLEESEGQRRARSLSRGRSVQGRWPPAQNQQQLPSSEGVLEPKPNNESESSTAIPVSPKRTSPTMKRSHSFDARPQYGGGLRSFHYKNHRPTATSTSIEMKDEKKECDDRSATSEPMRAGKDEDGDSNRQPVPSIKDRISVFAGRNNNKSNTASNDSSSKNNVKGYMKGAKPKINIYEDTNRATDEQQQPEDEEEEYSLIKKGQAEELTTAAPSAAAAAAAEEAYKYLRPSQMAASKNKLATRHSTGSNMNGCGSSVASSYLNGIQSPSNNTNNRYSYNQAPVPEVVPSDENINNYPGSSNNNFDSTSSVGASSCGDNDSIGNKMNRKPSSWRSYNSNNYLSPHNSNNNNNSHARSTSSAASNHSNNNNTVTVSAEMLERMVDERVQSQLRAVEARMEKLLRAWMDAMNNKSA